MNERIPKIGRHLYNVPNSSEKRGPVKIEPPGCNIGFNSSYPYISGSRGQGNGRGDCLKDHQIA